MCKRPSGVGSWAAVDACAGQGTGTEAMVGTGRAVRGESSRGRGRVEFQVPGRGGWVVGRGQHREVDKRSFGRG